jgi:cathepsin L
MLEFWQSASRLRALLGRAVVAVCVPLFGALAQTSTTQAPLKPFDPEDLRVSPAYNDKLANASPEIRERLRVLQAEAQSRQWTFSVGYTGVMGIPLERLTGTRIPDNFLEIARMRNAFTEEAVKLNETLRAERHGTAPPAVCSPTALKFDWRTIGKVTPVRNQRSCGSCWAFAAMGAYESSYLIHNNLSIDVSEQHVQDCATYADGQRAGTCAAGGWYDPVFNWMLTHGAADETIVSYASADQACLTNVTTLYRADVWGFVTDQQTIPTVEQIKQAICAHGAVAVTVLATPAFQAYTGGVFNETATGPINHAVVLTGWDDDRGAWRMKNSWSTDWGDEGFMWIRYGSNSIGFAAAWVQAKAPGIAFSPKFTALLQKYKLLATNELKPAMDVKVAPEVVK